MDQTSVDEVRQPHYIWFGDYVISLNMFFPNLSFHFIIILQYADNSINAYLNSH